MEPEPKPALYHYTNESGLDGIVDSRRLNQSLGAVNPNDTEGVETRKIELYADNRVGFADATGESGGTILAEGLMPSLEEINAQEEFSAASITEQIFDSLWKRYVG